MENLFIFLGIIGVFFLLMRRGGGGMGCCGGGHAQGGPPEQTEEESKENPQIKQIKEGPSDRKASGCH